MDVFYSILGFCLLALLITDIFLRANIYSLTKKNNNALDLSFPIKVLNRYGAVKWCHGLGKKAAVVGPNDYTRIDFCSEIPLIDFKENYTSPKHLTTLVDKLLIEKDTVQQLKDAAQELNQFVGS